MSDALGNGNHPQYPAEGTGDTVLEVRDLAVEYALERGTVRAVDGVSFDLSRG